MLTKEQERLTLAKIEKLIAYAGPESYIAQAFRGCCEMAAGNIENDAWNSMETSRDVAWDQQAALERECETLKRAVARKNDELEELRDLVKAECAKQLPADLYKRLWLLVDEKGRAAITRMDELTETLADLAGTPQDTAVAASLKNLAKAKKERDEALSLLQELDKYEPENC